MSPYEKCPACGGKEINPHEVKYYKCGNCGAFWSNVSPRKIRFD